MGFSHQKEHQCPVRRVQVEADHVPELGLELLVVGQLEDAHPMRFDVMGAPNSPPQILAAGLSRTGVQNLNNAASETNWWS